MFNIKTSSDNFNESIPILVLYIQAAKTFQHYPYKSHSTSGVKTSECE